MSKRRQTECAGYYFTFRVMNSSPHTENGTAEKPPWFFSTDPGYGGPIKTEKPLGYSAPLLLDPLRLASCLNAQIRITKFELERIASS